VGLPNPFYAFPASMTLMAVLTSRDAPSPMDSHLYYIPAVFRWDPDSQSLVGDPLYRGPRRALPRSLLKPGGVGKIRVDFYATDPIDILLDV
jgi:hypothetical protein